MNNTSVAATQAVQAVDTVNPSVVAADNQTGTASDTNAVVGYTITFSEAVTGFVVGDVVVAGGTVSNFAGSGTTYTFDVTATDNSTANITVNVAANIAADAVANGNTIMVEAVQGVDTVNPTLTITDDQASIVSDSDNTVIYTFTFSEAVTGFAIDDVIVTGGTKGTFTAVSATVYTLLVTADDNSTTNITVDVAASAALDVVNNTSVAATQAVQAVDTVNPTVTITMSDSALKIGDTSLVTITFSEAVTGFSNADLTVANGTLSAVASTDGGITWSATFTTTTAIESTTNTIALATTYADVAGNTGTIASSSNYAVDTLAPTLAITSNVAAVKSGETATVTFTFSEVPTGFAAGDVTTTGGTLSTPVVTANPNVYTATFTPTANLASGSASITVASATYTDAAGNTGGAGTTPSITIDTLAPITPTITTIATDNIISGAEKIAGVAISGSAEAGSSVAITLGGVTQTVTADAISGEYTTTFATANIPSDTSSTDVTVVATDTSGNISQTAIHRIAIDTLAPATPTVDGWSMGSTVETLVFVNGEAEAGSSVTITLGMVTQTVTANTLGVYTTTFTLDNIPVEMSSANVTVVVTDTAGNVSSSATRDISINNLPPVSHNIVSGTITAGPILSINGLSVNIYNADGSTLLGKSPLSSSGTFSVDVGTYTGVIFAKVVNANAGVDYMDEATGQGKDLTATLMAVAVVPGGNITVNMNAITSIASIKAGVSSDGVVPAIISAQVVVDTNTAVATAFGLTNILTIEPVATIAVDGTANTNYNTADSLSAGEKYGAVLAALSGADQSNGGNSQVTINALASGLTISSNNVGTLSTVALDSVIVGARTASVNATGTDSNSLTAIVSNLTTQVSASVAIDHIAIDDVINLSEQTAAVVITGTTVEGATVELSIGGNSRSATVNTTTWSYTLTSDDITAMGQGGETIRATATLAGGSTAIATRSIVVDTEILSPSITTIATDNIINATEKAAGVVIAGTAEAGSSVAVTLGAEMKTATANVTGTYTTTFTAANIPSDTSSTNVTVVATDAAGNIGSTATQTIVIDTIAPTTPTINTIAGDNIISGTEKAAGITIGGTAEAGSSVTITLGTVTQTVTANENGTYTTTFVSADIPADISSATVTVVATDLAGNSSQAATQVVTINDTAINTIDGAPITVTNTVTDINGHTVITESMTVSEVTDNRVEDITLNATADIPLFWGENPITDYTKWITMASLPVGVGLSAEGSNGGDLLTYIDDTTLILDSETSKAMHQGGVDFLKVLEAKTKTDTLIVNKVTLTSSPQVDTTQPIMITGTTNIVHTATSDFTPTKALLIDAQALPENSKLNLENIEFAVILGENLTIRGGAGNNTVFTGTGSQNIVLGAGNDELHAGAGNDVVGSLSGNDSVYGDAGDDVVFGGSGWDTL